MARVFTTGFEMGDLLEFENPGGSVSATEKRSGVYALNINEYWGADCKKTLSAQSEYYFRFGFWSNDHTAYLSDAKFIRWYKGGTVLGELWVITDRAIDARVGGVSKATSATGVLIDQTWQLIEVRVKIDDINGIIQVKVDGVLVIDFSGDTKPGADTQIDGFSFWEKRQNRCFDDVAVNDTTGGADNGWPGDGHVVALMPNGAGNSTQFSLYPNTGEANYEDVDERPKDDDTTYVYSSTIDQKDLYALAASGLTGKTIKRVWAECRAKETVAEGGEIALVIRTYSTDYQDADQALTLSYACYKGAEDTVNPNTAAAWTVAELDALEAGVVCR